MGKNASTTKGNLVCFETKKPLLPKYIRWRSGGIMMLKTRPIILRIHSLKKQEYREGICSELLLFYPWKNEKKVRAEFDIDCEIFSQTMRK